MARLGTICSDSIETLKPSYRGYIDYIDISSIDNKLKRIVSTQRILANEAPSRAKQIVQKGDILISTVRPNLNAVAFVDEDYNMPVASTGYCVLRCNDSIDKRYVFHYCQSQHFVDVLSAQAAGASYPAVSNAIVKNTEIPLPTLHQQTVISQAFDQINSLISLRKKQLQKLDDLVKSRFVEMFKAESPSNCSKCIHDFAEVFSGFAFSSEDFCENAVPVIRISNINDGKVFPDHSICFPIDFWEKNERYRVLQGDILMAMSGATTGKAGISTYSGPLLLNQRVACIRAKKEVSTREFLFVATQLPWMYDLIQEASAGCAQPNISGKQIERLPIPEAKHEEQKAFSIFVNQIEDLKLTVQQGLDKLELLKQSLMQKYFG